MNKTIYYHNISSARMLCGLEHMACRTGTAAQWRGVKSVEELCVEEREERAFFCAKAVAIKRGC